MDFLKTISRQVNLTIFSISLNERCLIPLIFLGLSKKEDKNRRRRHLKKPALDRIVKNWKKKFFFSSLDLSSATSYLFLFFEGVDFCLLLFRFRVRSVLTVCRDQLPNSKSPKNRHKFNQVDCVRTGSVCVRVWVCLSAYLPACLS